MKSNTTTTIRRIFLSIIVFTALTSCSRGGGDWPDSGTSVEEAKKAVSEKVANDSKSCLKLISFKQTGTTKMGAGKAGPYRMLKTYCVKYEATVQATVDCYRRLYPPHLVSVAGDIYVGFQAAKSQSLINDESRFMSKDAANITKGRVFFTQQSDGAPWKISRIETTEKD